MKAGDDQDPVPARTMLADTQSSIYLFSKRLSASDNQMGVECVGVPKVWISKKSTFADLVKSERAVAMEA